jgi:hypothetical protein
MSSCKRDAILSSSASVAFGRVLVLNIPRKPPFYGRLAEGQRATMHPTHPIRRKQLPRLPEALDHLPSFMHPLPLHLLAVFHLLIRDVCTQIRPQLSQSVVGCDNLLLFLVFKLAQLRIRHAGLRLALLLLRE